MARVSLGTQDACIAMFDFFYGPDVQVRVDAVGRGVLDYNPAEAQRCIGALPGACMMFEADEPLEAFRGVCAGVFEGGRLPGADCTSDEDCSGAAVCDADPLGEPVCLGYCRLQARPGDPCEFVQECSAEGGFSAYCDGTTNRCRLHRQAGPVGEGEACGWIPAGNNTVDVVRCETSLWCDAAYLETGVCRQPIAADAPCESEAQPCVDGYACLGGTCRWWTIQTTEGAPCRAAEYEVCDATARLVCGPSEVCELAEAGTTEGCSTSYDCGDEMICAESHQCAPVRENGEECRYYSDCRSRFCAQHRANEPHRCLPRYCNDG